MSFRIFLVVIGILVSALPACGQSVLVCKLEREGAVAKQKDSGSFSTEIVKGDPVTLVFANLNAVKPTLKIGTVEMQLELLHVEGDTLWLQGFTDEIFGKGVSIWTLDRKARVVIRSEIFRSESAGKLVGLLSTGKCE